MRMSLLLALTLSSCITYKVDPPKFAYLSCVEVISGEYSGFVGRISAFIPPTGYRVFNDVGIAEVDETELKPLNAHGDVCTKGQ